MDINIDTEMKGGPNVADAYNQIKAITTPAISTDLNAKAGMRMMLLCMSSYGGVPTKFQM